MLRPWTLALSERIVPASETPIYMQIIQSLIRDIERDRLKPGTFLPSSRELATALGVNRKTVVLAYEDLVAQGWLVSAGTRGTMVSLSLPEPTQGRRNGEKGAATQDGQEVEPLYEFAQPPERPLALPRGKQFKLDEGTPDGRLMPPQLLARAYRSAVHRVSRRNGLCYGDPRGSEQLRALLVDMLKNQRGLSVDEKELCITRGSQHGIFLAAQILIQPGDAVIVEALTYEPAVAAFRARGAEIIPVGLDGQGINVEEVEAVCRQRRIRALFLTPHHQFPTTVALRPERRLRLLELSRQHGFPIIEDDYDHEFRFESQPLLPMAAYAPGQIIYVGSLSKLLVPALRVGYIAAPRSVIDAISHVVSVSDGMGNCITEEATADLIDSGELRRHARKVRQIYARRRQAFAVTLDRELGDLIDFETPAGGLAFWLRFRRTADLEQAERGAVARGLSFAPSQSFVTRNDAPRGLRLGFASLTEHEAGQALGALRDAVTAAA